MLQRQQWAAVRQRQLSRPQQIFEAIPEAITPKNEKRAGSEPPVPCPTTPGVRDGSSSPGAARLCLACPARGRSPGRFPWRARECREGKQESANGGKSPLRVPLLNTQTTPVHSANGNAKQAEDADALEGAVASLESFLVDTVGQGEGPRCFPPGLLNVLTGRAFGLKCLGGESGFDSEWNVTH